MIDYLLVLFISVSNGELLVPVAIYNSVEACMDDGENMKVTNRRLTARWPFGESKTGYLPVHGYYCVAKKS